MYRSHEAIVGPDLNMIAHISNFSRLKVDQIKDKIMFKARQVLKDFKLDNMFDKYTPAKRMKHLETFFKQMRAPHTILTSLIVERFPKGGETFHVDCEHVNGVIVGTGSSKRPRGVNQAVSDCIGPMLVLNQIMINLMKKTWAPAAIGLSLEALGNLLTENRQTISNNCLHYGKW